MGKKSKRPVMLFRIAGALFSGGIQSRTL